MLNAIFASMDNRVESGKKYEITMLNGNTFTGFLKKERGKYWVVFRRKGLEGRISVGFNNIAFKHLKEFSLEGGFNLEENQLIMGLLLAGLSRWDEARLAFDAAPDTSSKERWLVRISLFSGIAVENTPEQKIAEETARELYKDLVEAFKEDDWDEVTLIATTLLKDFGNTSTIKDRKKTILEMLRIAKGDNAEPLDNTERTFDFSNAEKRNEFFYRRFGGDVGNLEFDKRGTISVGSGKDGLLLFRRPFDGNVTVSFNMRISNGAELRVALRNDALGGGMVFTSSDFGPYDLQKTRYRRGGSKVVLEWDEKKGLKVTVDGKQEREFSHIGKRNSFLAIYFLGSEAKLWKLQIKGTLGKLKPTIDSILKDFNVISFAEIRKQDIEGSKQ